MFSCEKNFDEFIPVASVFRIPAHFNKINVTTKPDTLLFKHYNIIILLLVILVFVVTLRFARWFWGDKGLVNLIVIITIYTQLL